jgi:hypothetical protein
MNLLNRDLQQLLKKAKKAGCVEQVKALIDKAAFSMWGPSLRRVVDNFIRHHEAEKRPVGIIHRQAEVKPREPLIPPGAWKR